MMLHKQLPTFELRVASWLMRARFIGDYSVQRIEGEGMFVYAQFLHHWEGGGRRVRGAVCLGLIRIPLHLQSQGRFKRLLQICCLLGGSAVVLRIVTTETGEYFDLLRRWGFVQVSPDEWGYFKADGGPWPLGTTLGPGGEIEYPPLKDWYPRRKRTPPPPSD
ncbi:hypothetical protein [Variovorax sp. Sphag1AA]|uniref:hypothetical protein n=1 Tax=Variovorax sp. Sphag1AA TaxID=2587027 RepID=UPI0016109BB3|nr:hypothetical protein [Variovorax sp. Sphag1AA]MBB3182270.1 hypothetical protein [Variovorax sp. Sphag1AA]